MNNNTLEYNQLFSVNILDASNDWRERSQLPKLCFLMHKHAGHAGPRDCHCTVPDLAINLQIKW